MTILPQLTEEELIALRAILNKFSQPTENIEIKQEESTPKKQRGRPKKDKQEKKEGQKSKTKILDSVDDKPYDPVEILSDVKAKPRRSTNTKKAQSKSSKPKFIRVTREIGGGPNLFELSSDFNSHLEDVEIDKKLSRNGRIKPVQRRSDPTTFVKIRCSGCGKQVKAHPMEICKGTPYRCNNCVTGQVSPGGYDDDYEDD